jgi:hypothetical protein
LTRVRIAPLAILAILVSAGAVAAFTVPSAASKGLAIGAEQSGRTVPAFPTTSGTSLAPKADPASDVDVDAGTEADLPDAANHGAAVAAVAQADDTTPDTNHGADVSAIAKQQGQTVAASHRPADAGPPIAVPPVDPGTPPDPGPPVDPGPPDGVGRP